MNSLSIHYHTSCAHTSTHTNTQFHTHNYLLCTYFNNHADYHPTHTGSHFCAQIHITTSLFFVIAYTLHKLSTHPYTHIYLLCNYTCLRKQMYVYVHTLTDLLTRSRLHKNTIYRRSRILVGTKDFLYLSVLADLDNSLPVLHDLVNSKYKGSFNT